LEDPGRHVCRPLSKRSFLYGKEEPGNLIRWNARLQLLSGHGGEHAEETDSMLTNGLRKCSGMKKKVGPREEDVSGPSREKIRLSKKKAEKRESARARADSHDFPFRERVGKRGRSGWMGKRGKGRRTMTRSKPGVEK